MTGSEGLREVSANTAVTFLLSVYLNFFVHKQIIHRAYANHFLVIIGSIRYIPAIVLPVYR